MFQPIVPDTGLVAWRFLQRTYDSQLETFQRNVTLQRDADYFRETIGTVTRAEDLVKDRLLLGVALGAFGLQDDIDNRYFIRKILEEGTGSDDALAVRLADTRYRDLSDAFGYGPGMDLQVGRPGFAEGIVARYEANAFEVAAGEQNPSMRVALYGQRALEDLATEDGSVNKKWYTLMGDPPMRQLMEKALSLPSSVGQIDIDRQLGIFKERARAIFGSDDPAIFAEKEVREKAITRFLLREQVEALGTGLDGNAIALTLLSTR